MLSEFLNACIIFFVPAIVIACAADHEDAGALILLAAGIVVLRAVVWMQGNLKSGGSTMEGKWYLSITFWLNILAVLVAVAAELFGFGDFEPAPWVDGVVLAIIAIVNLIRHFFPDVKMGPVTL